MEKSSDVLALHLCDGLVAELAKGDVTLVPQELMCCLRASLHAAVGFPTAAILHTLVIEAANEEVECRSGLPERVEHQPGAFESEQLECLVEGLANIFRREATRAAGHFDGA